MEGFKEGDKVVYITGPQHGILHGYLGTVTQCSKEVVVIFTDNGERWSITDYHDRLAKIQELSPSDCS